MFPLSLFTIPAPVHEAAAVSGERVVACSLPDGVELRNENIEVGDQTVVVVHQSRGDELLYVGEEPVGTLRWRGALRGLATRCRVTEEWEPTEASPDLGSLVATEEARRSYWGMFVWVLDGLEEGAGTLEPSDTSRVSLAAEAIVRSLERQRADAYARAIAEHEAELEAEFGPDWATAYTYAERWDFASIQ